MTFEQINKGHRAYHREFGVKPITAEIDWEAVGRIEKFAADARAEMGEERWNQLQAEWGA